MLKSCLNIICVRKNVAKVDTAKLLQKLPAVPHSLVSKGCAQLGCGEYPVKTRIRTQSCLKNTVLGNIWVKHVMYIGKYSTVK